MVVEIATILTALFAFFLALRFTPWIGWIFVLLIDAWYIDVGFAMKPFFIFGGLMTAWIFVKRGGAYFVRAVISDGRFVLLFVLTMLIAAGANGFQLQSVRQIILIAITIAFARLAAMDLREHGNLSHVIFAIEVGATILAGVSLVLYLLYRSSPYLLMTHPLTKEFIHLGIASVVPRIAGMETDPNAFATKLVLFLGVIAMGFRKRKAFRHLKMLLAASLLGCIILSGSRAGLVTALALLAITGITRHKGTPSPEEEKRSLKLAVACVSLAVLVLVTSLCWQDLGTWFSSYFEARSRFSLSRVMLWEHSLEAFLKNPLFGVGQGMMSSVSYQLFGIEKQTHNTFIELLAENGIAVTVVFILYLCQAVQRALKAIMASRLGESRVDLSALFVGWLGILLMMNSLSIISFPLFWVVTEVLMVCPAIAYSQSD